MADNAKSKRKTDVKTLKPRKHKQLDFFITDDIDISSFRDELASMEHPFFALKAGDLRVREYKNGSISITVRPAAEIGLATIFDKDVWLFAISKLQEAINNDKPISKTVVFTPYDYLVQTNREIGGRTYKELENSLSRLKGTTVKTNICHSPDEHIIREFGLIEEWMIIENKKGKMDVGMISVTLPDWLYEAVTSSRVLRISHDYFRIRKAIDRRLYEIARKHCGAQHEFIISVEKLHWKTGSTSNKAEFRRLLKRLCVANDLPDYEVFYSKEKDQVIFKNRDQKKPEALSSKRRESGKKAIYNIKRKYLTKIHFF